MKKIIFLLAWFFLAVFFAKEALALEYGQIGGKPANPDASNPNSNAWFIYNLKPGESKEDAIIVMNLSDKPWDALVYAADSVKSSSGGFALRQYAEAKEAVGSWVKFYPQAQPDFAKKIFEKNSLAEVCKLSADDLAKKYQFKENEASELENWCKGEDHVEWELKANEKKSIPFVFSVPNSVDVGEHTGGILIQKQSKDEVQQTGGSKVKLTTRVGIRIYETVPGEIIKKISLGAVSLSKNFKTFFFPWDKNALNKYGEYSVITNIKNEGNISIDFKEKIIIKKRNLGFFGKDEVLERDFQVLRGDEFSSVLAWEAPFFGRVSFEKVYSYTDNDAKQVSFSAPVEVYWFFAWYYLLLALLILALVFSSYWWYRKTMKKKYGGVGWKEYEVAEGETIASLAVKFALDWKVLAKTNRIKAPYFLRSGQIIKVPDFAGKMVKMQELSKIEKPVKPSKKEPKALKKTNTTTTICDFWGKNITSEEDPETIEIINKKPIVLTKNKKCFKFNFSFISSNKLFFAIILVLFFIIALAGFFVYQINKKNVKLEAKLVNMAQTQKEPNPPTNLVVEKTNQEVSSTKVEQKNKETLEIKIYNGGASAGMAGKVKNFLEQSGYKNPEAKNAEKEDHIGTVVYFKDIAEIEGQWIQKLLSNKYQEKVELKSAGQDDEQQSADIVVIIGE